MCSSGSFYTPLAKVMNATVKIESTRHWASTTGTWVAGCARGESVLASILNAPYTARPAAHPENQAVRHCRREKEQKKPLRAPRRPCGKTRASGRCKRCSAWCKSVRRTRPAPPSFPLSLLAGRGGEQAGSDGGTGNSGSDGGLGRHAGSHPCDLGLTLFPLAPRSLCFFAAILRSGRHFALGPGG
jgi:hypothetical protein